MSEPDVQATLGATGESLAQPGHCKSFCIHLWNHLRVAAGGEAQVCCAFEGGNIAEDGVPVSIEHQSLRAIWNTDMVRKLRRDMVEGRRIAGCRQCYTDEAGGGVSMRMRDNASWEGGWLNPKRATIGEIATLAVENDYRLPHLPALIEVEIGNLCDFKCRMCNGATSSLIAKDRVHQSWAEDQFSGQYHNSNIEPGPYRFRRATAIGHLSKELANDVGGDIKRLYFIGGEPMLVREVGSLLETLVAADRAKNIELAFVSNGSTIPKWMSLSPHFRRVDIAISVDGYSDVYEYIRPPGRWSALITRLHELRQLPNVNVLVTTTIQILNVLSITQLFRYLDSIELRFQGYLLHWPRYLAVHVLPLSIRHLAANRLKDYANSACRPQHRALIQSLAAQLEAGNEVVDPHLLREFMLFTNDLDASRGQSIHRMDPELVALFADAGFPWTKETLHAARK